VYLNVTYVIATRNYELFYIYSKSHWKYHDRKIVIIPVAALN